MYCTLIKHSEKNTSANNNMSIQYRMDEYGPTTFHDEAFSVSVQNNAAVATIANHRLPNDLTFM
jgi:hypothetical protein